ncbi:lysozyme [Serratia marcescens]|uniref:lysozyme n=1 Tax=Serratia marcescens TaxID=615 RepID=UPI002238F50B|nr:lysozyme [Serratia marcescens]MCW6023242.1 lysozyme [Serratia marcescens]
MKVSCRGLELIKRFEGLFLQAYFCPANVLTIGYGHTADVQIGKVITAEQADAFLQEDTAESEIAVSQLVTVPLTQNQFDALVSFTFNLGYGNLRSSTLLKKLNGGDYTGAADEFSRWINGGGKNLPGLIKRREAEKALFSLNDDGM